MTAPPPDPRATLGGLVRTAETLRRRAVLGVALAALAAAGGIGAVGLLLPAPVWRTPGSPVPIVTALCLLGIAAAAGALAGRLQRTLTLERLGPEMESASGLGDGELTAALELARRDTSGSRDLAELQVRRVAQRLEGRGDTDLLPRTARRWRRLRRLTGAGALLVMPAVVAAGSADAGRARDAASALVSPWAISFPAPPPRPWIRASGTEVERGEVATVRIGASGREDISLRARVAAGEVDVRWLPVDPATGTAVGDVGPVLSPLAIWAADRSGSSSDTLVLQPFDPPFVTKLEARVRFPAYLGRRSETYSRPLPRLEIPAGSRVEVSGETNRPVSGIELVEKAMGLGVALRLEGPSFGGSLAPTRSGTWFWRVAAWPEDPPARPPPPLRISLIPDRAPTVRIAYPATDTVLPLDMVLPLVIDARDDHGVRSVALVSWRRSPAGDGAPDTAQLLEEAEPEERVLLRPVLDVRDRGLLPGDTVFYYARVRDDRPSGPVVTSDTFAVRLPSLRELGESRAVRTTDLAREAAAVAEAAASVEGDARGAARRAASRGTPAGQEEARADRSEERERASFRATEESRRLLEETKRLETRVRELHAEIQDVAAEVARSPAADPALRAHLERIDSLYRELMESDLGARIRDLQRALETLDPEALRRALNDLSARAADVRQSLEAAGTLLERVAAEQAMREVARWAEDLAADQAGLAADFAAEVEWIAREDEVTERAAALQAELEALRDRLRGNAGDRAAVGVEAGSRSLARGEESARRAAGIARMSSRRGSPDGRRAAGDAAEALREAADRLSAAGSDLSSEWREETSAAVDRATRDALSLAREQMQVADLLAGERRNAARGREAALREGLDNLLGSIAEVGGKTALLDRRVARAASQAATDMDRLLESLGRGGGGRDAAVAGRRLANALNDLAGELLATGEAVAGAESGTGMEEALEELSRLSRAQGGLSREGEGILALRREGRAIGARLQRLASEQASIAARLRELARKPGAGGLAARPDELAREAEDIARSIGSGDLDPATVERQQRLFRRLLDAGRTLSREEDDPDRRESRSAREIVLRTPADLTPTVREGSRYPHPGEEALRGLAPATRRIVLDYFDRINAGPAAEPRESPR
ncbi:MAG: hypothetical protein ACE5HF_04205 [Gemmatimonadota bacterium]